MEDSTSPTSSDQSWTDQLAGSLGRQRQRIEAFLAAQQEHLDQIEAELAGRVHRQHDELAGRLQEVEKRQSAVDAAEVDLHHDRHALTLAQAQHEAEVEHLAGRQEILEQKLAELETQRQELRDRQARTEGQRRRIARELNALRNALRKEQGQCESDKDEAIRSLHRQCEQLRRELASRREPAGGDDQRLDDLRQQLDDLSQQRDALAEELSQTKERLAKAEQRLAERPKTGDEDTTNDDYHRRYEMAISDLRELKSQNKELEQRLAQAQTAGGPAATGGAIDWESQKSRILAALQDDFDKDDETDTRERLKIEEVVQTTEKVLADKDKEIHELKHVLEQQSDNLGSVSVGANAVGEILDKDAIIREEREHLRRTQEELQEKMRLAEIDISVERAKIARQRAELEEMQRVMQKGREETSPDSQTPSQPDKPSRGRWLSRLGLADPQDD